MVVRVLLVDDEPDILAPVRFTLESLGFAVETVEDGVAALAAARSRPYDVVVLDVMMPGLQGTEVCRQLRAESILPIIMLTAKDAEVDRVLGLELGADDYVTKPFSARELASRIRAVLRRQELEREAVSDRSRPIIVGDIEIEPLSHRVRVAGREIRTTPSEFKLLALLAAQPNRVFSRWQIMEHLWNTSYVGTARAADVHVANLRKKIEVDPAHPARLLTVRDAGYKLSLEGQ